MDNRPTTLAIVATLSSSVALAAAAGPLSAPPVELLPQGDFSAAQVGALPANWSVVCANNATCPTFETSTHNGAGVLTAKGNGRVESFGWIESATTLPLEVGKTYCFYAELQFEGFDDLQRHTRVEINGQGYVGGVFDYERPVAADGSGATGWVTATKRFKYGWPAPMSSSNGMGTVRLYFKYSATGQLMWSKVSLKECPAPPQRKPVRIAAAWWDLSEAGFWPNGTAVNHLPYWERWLDTVGAEGVDIALLPEGFNGCGGEHTMRCVQPLMGPSGQLLQRMAKKWDMYVVGTFYAWGNAPNSSDLAYNSAPFFGRNGTLIGIHNKNELYDPEEDYGLSPGRDGFPVFETDVGRFGVMTCYESWFPETARLLGYKGAEVVLFPSAGYDARLMPARAADSGIVLVAATHHDPSMDTVGAEGR